MKTLQLACRRWVRHPSLAIGLCVVLSLGIGAATAMYSVIDAVLLRPVPFPAAERLVFIHATLPDRQTNPAFSGTWNRAPVSWSTWRDLERSPAFRSVGAWYSVEQILGPDRRDILRVFYVSTSWLSSLGLAPVLGTGFTEADDEDVSDRVLLTYEFWRRHFGGREDVIDQEILLAPTADSPLRSLRVIGVLPPRLSLRGESPDVLLPIGLMAWNGRFETNRFLRVVARLGDGISKDQALAAAEPLVRRTEPPDRRSAVIQTLLEDRAGDSITPLWMMLAAAGLLLVVACANAAALLLGDARNRRHEIFVRIALGARRRDLMIQLLAEQSIVSIVAASIGIASGVWITPAIIALAPGQLSITEAVALNRNILAAGVVFSTLTALLFALIPVCALSVSRTPSLFLAEQSGGRSTRRGHRFIVAAQIGLTLVLLVCTGLLAASFAGLASRPLGFVPEGIAVASVRYGDIPLLPAAASLAAPNPAPMGPIADVRETFARRMLSGWIHNAGLVARLRELPWVREVAVTNAAPFGGAMPLARIRIVGTPDSEEHLVTWLQVTDGYFETLELPILQGRGFTPADRQGPGVILVSRQFERRFLQGNGIGRRIMTSGAAYEVVGVVEDAKHTGLRGDELLACYRPDRAFMRSFDAVVRYSGEAPQVGEGLRTAISDFDPDMVVMSVSTMNAMVDRTIGHERFLATLSAAFAGFALLLASVGTYGVATRYVAEKKSEIGIRLALGARNTDIRRLVIRDGLITVGSGLAVGLPFAYLAATVARSLFFGVAPNDPRAFAAAAAALALAALCAMAIPAVRAGRTDPLDAIRYQ